MEGNIFETKQRLPWIDVSKGILILFVVLGHIEYYAQEFVGSHSYDFLHHILFLYLPYYIPAFFIVTGFCSNFDVPFKTFLVKNIKTLLVPSVLIGFLVARWIELFLYGGGLSVSNFLSINYMELCMTGGHWFLTTLFLSKMVLYLQRKYFDYSPILVFVVYLLMMLLGSLLYNNNILPNIWYFKHVLLLLPFLYLGSWLRTNPKWVDKRYHIPLGIAMLLLAFVMPRFGLPYPYIVGAPGVFWGNFLLCVVMVMFGTLMVFSVSIKIQGCKPFEILGKHSLMIFLLHSAFLIFFLRITEHIGITETTNIGLRMITFLIILSLSSIFPVFVDLWIDKHARYLKGKFY